VEHDSSARRQLGDFPSLLASPADQRGAQSDELEWCGTPAFRSQPLNRPWLCLSGFKSSRVAPQKTTGEQELIRRTGCRQLGAFRFKRAGADVDAARSSSGTSMSHRSPAADTKDCISSALRDAADQLRLPRYFLLRTKIVVSRIRTNGCHALRPARHRRPLAKEQHVASLRFHHKNLGQP
jgi:hypothetical protein